MGAIIVYLRCCPFILIFVYLSPAHLSLFYSICSITSSNKNYSHVRVQAPAFFAAAASRANVILAGDNIGDAHMAKGMDHADEIIRIGLLHDNVEARLEQFKVCRGVQGACTRHVRFLCVGVYGISKVL